MRHWPSILYQRLPDGLKLPAAAWTGRLCRRLGIKDLRGRLGSMPIYVGCEDNWGLRNFFFRTNYNIEQIARFRRLLEGGGSVFWDIGANYGAYTLLLAPHARKAVAVEPSGKTLRRLRRSCRASNLDVHMVPCAVGDRDTTIRLHLAKGFSGDDRIFAPPGENRQSLPVPMRKIDTIAQWLFEQTPHRNLMKIDVQGAEVLALRGMKRLIEQSDWLAIYLELWPEGLEAAGTCLDELIAVIESFPLELRNASLAPTTWDHIRHGFGGSENVRVQDVFLCKGDVPGAAEPEVSS